MSPKKKTPKPPQAGPSGPGGEPAEPSPSLAVAMAVPDLLKIETQCPGVKGATPVPARESTRPWLTPEEDRAIESSFHANQRAMWAKDRAEKAEAAAGEWKARAARAEETETMTALERDAAPGCDDCEAELREGLEATIAELTAERDELIAQVRGLTAEKAKADRELLEYIEAVGDAEQRERDAIRAALEPVGKLACGWQQDVSLLDRVRGVVESFADVCRSRDLLRLQLQRRTEQLDALEAETREWRRAKAAPPTPLRPGEERSLPLVEIGGDRLRLVWGARSARIEDEDGEQHPLERHEAQHMRAVLAEAAEQAWPPAAGAGTAGEVGP